ncbi:MAG TPA: HEAT repeat domain-containing protein [Tepidisphaeraceae bacterium]|jgi:putative heme-binding domain-containing protein|nr:HEAT repeat domain-containing protein [Tepidisphaeraceae bacterium]
MRKKLAECTSKIIARCFFAAFFSLPVATRGRDLDKNDPQAELDSFRVADGFEVSLFASEADGIVKPVQMRWDPRGRLFVSCIPSYPQPTPRQTPDDRIVVLEDTKHLGRADRSTVFARGLLMPLGLEIGDGGVYCTNGNDLVHLNEEGATGHAGVPRAILRGFFTGDSHQDINSFIWGPGGELMFCQGLHAFSRVETPWGIERLEKAGVWRYRPRIGRLDPFLGLDRGPQNPWGIVFDDWGQPVMTAGNGQGIYYLLPAMIRTTHFLDPRQISDLRNIKYCGVDIIDSKAMPANVQGRMVCGSILNNSVYWFKLNDDGSGFHAKDLPPLLVSTHSSFRPVDVKVGPDGAIYVADFYNPIIGHYQASLHHPDRDHVHGRIWRIAAKGMASVTQPELTTLSIPDLFEQLRSPERWTRFQTKRLLAEKEASPVCHALEKWLVSLDPSDPQYEHLLYESLGVFESQETINEKLLQRLLSAGDARARAYAVGVIGHWADRLPDAAGLLRRAAADESPRVRLEAVVSASYVPSPAALEAAMIVTDRPMDRFLNEALIQAVAALKPSWQPAFDAGQLTFDDKPERLAALCKADGSPDVLRSLLNLVRSGKLTGESKDGALALLASAGGADELTALLSDPAVWVNPNVAGRVLEAMADNFRLRKTAPAGDRIAILRRPLESKEDRLRAAAITLAGLWKIEAFRSEIESIAKDAAVSSLVRHAADEAMADLGGAASAKTLGDLAKPSQGTPASRSMAIVALARLDVNSAASFAAAELKDDGGAEAARLIPAFLARDGGADALAASCLTLKTLPKDSAKLALRALSASGGQSGRLWEVLSSFAGNSGIKLEYDPRLVESLAAEATTSGDPAAGERVFRSQMTNCFACHSIGGAGGHVGPDLAPVGTALPIDLVVESVLWPQRQIKEGYGASLVQTKDGDVLQGYRVSEDKSEYILREPATGRLIHIPVSNIKAKRDIGSLMPDGLTDGLTHKELVDLIRFLSELGKPGAYRVPPAPMLRAWETAPASTGSLSETPPSDPAVWSTRYSQTNGQLPLSEVAPTGSDLWAKCALEVTKSGKFALELNDPAGVRFWIDGKPRALSESAAIEFTAGRHTLTFGIEGKNRKSEELSCQLNPAPNPTGELAAPAK